MKRLSVNLATAPFVNRAVPVAAISTILGAAVTDGACRTTDSAISIFPSLDDNFTAYGGARLSQFAAMTSGYDGGTCGERSGGAVVVRVAAAAGFQRALDHLLLLL